MNIKYVLFTFVMSLVLMLVGCSSDADSVSVAVTTPEESNAVVDLADATPSTAEILLADVLSEDYEDALSARNQLALGLIRLDGTENAPTGEQAQTLAALWQALKALDLDPNAAAEESTAVQMQILETMRAEQIEAIKALQLTSVDLTDFYVEHGVEMSTPEADAATTMVRGKDLSTEDKEATRTAKAELGTPVGTTGSGSGSARRTVLLDTLIDLLQSRS